MLYIPWCGVCPFYRDEERSHATGELWTKSYCTQTGNETTYCITPPRNCPIQEINKERRDVIMRMTEIVPNQKKLMTTIDRNASLDEKIKTLIDNMKIAFENGNDFSVGFDTGQTITFSNEVIPEMIKLLRE
jgi:hypothetical protein